MWEYSTRIPASQTFYPIVPRMNIMVGNDIKLSISNGIGLEDPKQYWFLCEVVWTVRHVQYEAIKKAHMITTLRGRALNWYMKFSMVLTGVAQKMLNHI